MRHDGALAALDLCLDRRELILTQFCVSAVLPSPAKLRVAHPLWELLRALLPGLGTYSASRRLGAPCLPAFGLVISSCK